MTGAALAIQLLVELTPVMLNLAAMIKEGREPSDEEIAAMESMLTAKEDALDAALARAQEKAHGETSGEPQGEEGQG